MILLLLIMAMVFLQGIPTTQEEWVLESQAKDYTNNGCVSWVKDRAAQIGITLPATGTNKYGLYGASAYWDRLASYGRGSEPAANALAVWEFNNGSDGAGGKYGHVAFVESVSGNNVTVTEGGCAGYSYNGHTGVIRRTTTKSGIATLGGCSGFLGYIYLTSGGSTPPSTSGTWTASATNITETNATLSATYNVGYNVQFQWAGCNIFDVNGTMIAQAGESTSVNYAYINIIYNVNSDTNNRLQLQPGTTYKYQFYATFGGVDHFSPMYSFKTAGSSHTHSYSSTVTKAATCTGTGVRTYRCSCGYTYTATIQAKGHSYVKTVVKPTLTAKGYTLHVCLTCLNTYKDTYVDAPTLKADGWYYCTTMPNLGNANDYIIEYNNYYEKIQKNSPGAGWTKVATVKCEWQNSGAQYTSEYDLATSNERVLVRSIYYHFCGPNAGSYGNYEQTGNYVHYDEVDAGAYGVIAYHQGYDAGHPYYVLDWSNGGGRIYCQSGVTCDGSYGSHGSRCQAWYKMNTYQDRVKVEEYKYAKYSGWGKEKSSSAKKVEIRIKKKSNTTKIPTAIKTVTTKLYGHDDVQISWSKSSNANYYQVYYKKASAKNYTYLGKTTKTLYKKANLVDGVKYTFYVRPVYIEGEKVLTKGTAKTSSIYTLKKIAKPKISKKSSSKVKVSWKNISGESGYQISKSTKKTKTNIVSTYKTTGGKSKTISTKKGVTYYYKVRAYKIVGSKKIYGPWSGVVTYKIKK